MLMLASRLGLRWSQTLDASFSSIHGQIFGITMDDFVKQSNDLLPNSKRREIFVPGYGTAHSDPGILQRNQEIIVRDAHYKGKFPIERLPVELLLEIFDFHAMAIADRLILTHVCRRWRLLLLNTPTFWSQIVIAGNHETDGRRFARLFGPDGKFSSTFISLLSMQLERVGDVLLDVVWVIHVSPQMNIRVIELCREKAPFSRWRSLTLVDGLHSWDPPQLDRSDVFTNLESLVLRSNLGTSILDAICLTPRLKIKEFDLHVVYPWKHGMPSRRLAIFYRISRLTLPSSHLTPPTLSRNIVELQAGDCETYTYPHLLRLEVPHCNFKASSEVDMGRLTSLFVTTSIRIAAGCHVDLPSLRHLEVEIIQFEEGATLYAPQLELLRLRPAPRHSIKLVDEMLYHPGYLLYPTRSLILDRMLQKEQIFKLFSYCENTRHVMICIGDDLSAQLAMEYLFGPSATRSPTPTSDSMGIPRRMCPNLSDLQLKFHWNKHSVDAWKSRALQIADSRGRTLSVYATWDGEGTYFKLT